VAKKNTAAANLKDFIEYLQSNSSKLTYGHAGVGSIAHVSGLVFNAKFGLKPTLVPYRGTGPAIQDLVAGQLDYMVDQSLNVIPQILGGLSRFTQLRHRSGCQACQMCRLRAKLALILSSAPGTQWWRRMARRTKSSPSSRTRSTRHSMIQPCRHAMSN